MDLRKAIAGAALGALVCSGLSLPLSTSQVEAASRTPNIVVVYTDDFSPDAEWLWSDHARTPALAKFVDEGVRFGNATAVTSLCGPARASMLTGTYGHTNGVTWNDPAEFDAGSTVAPRLQQQGYHTVYVGKYLNRLRAYAPKPRDVWDYAQGWDEFDVLHTLNGKFYDYPLWTKEGERRYGTNPEDHSTRVLAQRAARHIVNAPKDKPIFEILSIYNGHTPNLPMPRFKGHPMCADVEPWQGPAYNEDDVSDKPQYVQESPKLPSDSYDLRSRCEEMMTIDWAVREVRRALREAGRLEDTLLVLTSDNGWSMGDHRLKGKVVSYSNPVILYMLWPRRSSTEPRVIRERVQNVDLAPTFCEIAGCKMPRADGMSLLPLLVGKTGRLKRDFVYEEQLHRNLGPAYYGLRTTRRFSRDHLWVYTEHSTGERELYDRAIDPWQLDNLALDPAHQETAETLHQMLHQDVIDPDGVAFIPSTGLVDLDSD